MLLKIIVLLLFLEILFSLKYLLTLFLRTFTNSGVEVSNCMGLNVEITLNLRTILYNIPITTYFVYYLYAHFFKQLHFCKL